MILWKIPAGPLETNAILLACSKTRKAAAIDPAQGSTGPLLAKAAELHLSIEKILLTHSHWDHFADAAELKEKTKAPLYVHALDRENLCCPGSDGIPLYIDIPPVSADQSLAEGQVVEVGELRLEVIHTPGHCPGAVCFYEKAQGVLISGDTLFRGSMGALHLPTAEPAKMGVSLARLAQLPPETRVIPGHGAETTIGQENWLKRFKE